MIDVVMPQMGESIVEGTLTKWLKKAGERVERDESLFEISTDKVDVELPSPASGTVSEILVQEGDTVTVGETSGTVTRIRIRATTITDWDRKELLVPNKEFVTGRLVNWTLSDKILRITLKVGIAYGSDTGLAEKQLLKVAAEHPRVLKDPEPVALFHDFGESTLNFELRVYIEGISHYVQTRHDLNRSIDKAFREAGIEIAFPQRDIHVRSVASERDVLGQHDVVDDA